MIGDSIQDWRDPNDEHRANGAESDDYYLKLPMPYRAHNANLESITELLQIKGITPAIYNGSKDHPGLASLVTVRSTGTVNMNTAGPAVLTALGLSTAEITEIQQSRRLSGPLSERAREIRRQESRRLDQDVSRRGGGASWTIAWPPG